MQESPQRGFDQCLSVSRDLCWTDVCTAAVCCLGLAVSVSLNVKGEQELYFF